MTSAVPEPRILSSMPGRVRIHLAGVPTDRHLSVERHLRALPGVRSAQASLVTDNVLVLFDRAATSAGAILEALHGLEPHRLERSHHTHASSRPTVLAERAGKRRRLRIPVRGIDRDPDLARRVVERIQETPGVRATANPLTGRVLVEFGEKVLELEQVVAEIERLELPDLPGDDRPHHPLDPAPLWQSTTRAIGAAVGLSFIVGRRLLGAEPIVPVSVPARVAGLLGLIQGFPFVRRALRQVFGRSASDFFTYAPIMVGLALSDSILGLTLTGVEAVRLLNEVLARRTAWRRYEERLADAPSHHPGAVVRIESGVRAPRRAQVMEGTGVAVGRDGLPRPVAPGGMVAGGSRLYGGPFALALQGHEAFTPRPRPAEIEPGFYDRYVSFTGLASLAYAVVRGLITRSAGGVLESLLLVNPRAAVVGSDLADIGAATRVLRAGVTVVGTRPTRHVRRPHLLLLDSPRLLTNGFELARVIPLHEGHDGESVVARAAGVALAAGTPWGAVLPTLAPVAAHDGRFDGTTAEATEGGRRWRLGPLQDWSLLRPSARVDELGPQPERSDRGTSREAGDKTEARSALPPLSELRGEYPLLLSSEDAPLGVVVLRPRLARGVEELIRECSRAGVELAMLSAGDPLASQAVSARARVPMLDAPNALAAIREAQERGLRVAFVADHAAAAEAFDACDLAIGLAEGRTGPFPARADLLAPDLGALAAIVEAAGRRERGVRDALVCSLGANVVGAVWGLRAEVAPEKASLPVYVAALAAAAATWLRLRGGERPRSVAVELADPHPEKWGGYDVPTTLHMLQSRESGLSAAEAQLRHQAELRGGRPDALLRDLLDQFRSPMPGILMGAAGLALVLDAPFDFVIIVATILVNLGVGIWQERQTGRAAEARERVSAPAARLLRDGGTVTVPAAEIVPGDILLLAPGDRVAADARLIHSHALEVDEAMLTGESVPVTRSTRAMSHAGRVVLEGSDVVAGTGRAVVVAVGRQTRLGATAQALSLDEAQHSPLGVRLGRMLRQILPLATAGGGLVFASGLWQGRPLLPQLAVGASIALAAVPEGLPLLAGMGQVAVSRRLAGRKALVKRLSAVEALGRVDVACTDKTGTLTEGKLAVALVAHLDGEAPCPGPLDERSRQALLCAALASPHPDAVDAAAHPTDVAVVQAAERAGMEAELRGRRQQDAPFEPSRSFHATRVNGRVFVKGAPEALAERCTHARRGDGDAALDETGRRDLLDRAEALAERGLRVLLVAQGSSAGSVDEPRGLTALGFLGIRDPLRPGAPAAVAACHRAGIRVLMLTGDHPATARAIAREAGLDDGPAAVVTGPEIESLDDAELDRRLAGAHVVARATPLDKLRIIDSLQRCGHVVAMTGDGVNDAPALRLADVGVAMGRAGTEVARQASDLILGDDDFATLVQALLEGRGFWRNMRRSLGLLLGGNLGELGMVVGATALGAAAPLTVPQILAVNLLTDALPALSITLQPPEHRNLALLAREGTHAIDHQLRHDVVRRGAATALPSLASYLLALSGGASVAQARSVAFASVVATQLAQTLDAGWSEQGASRPVLRAVAASTALLAGFFAVPAASGVLALSMPGTGWMAVGAGAVTAVALSRLLGWARPERSDGGTSREAGDKAGVRPALPPLSDSDSPRT